MQCPSCHSKLPDTAQECTFCGASTTPVTLAMTDNDATDMTKTSESHITEKTHPLTVADDPESTDNHTESDYPALPVAAQPPQMQVSTLTPMTIRDDGDYPPLPYAAQPLYLRTLATSQPIPYSRVTPTLPASMARPYRSLDAPDPEPGGFQRLLQRLFGARLARHPIVTIVAGGLIAGAVEIAIFTVLLFIINKLLIGSVAGEHVSQATFYSWLLIDPLQNLFRESMYLLLTAHGIQHYFEFTYSSTQSSVVGSTSEAVQFPLHGLFFIPMLSLILGGYIAAAGDFSNRASRSLLRGAAVAIPYTFILLLLAGVVNGPLPLAKGSTYHMVLTLNTFSLLCSGLCWGGLCGLVGASLKLARGQWRAMFYQAVQSSPIKKLLGTVIGAGSAILLGFALSLLLVLTALAFTSFSQPFLNTYLCLNTVRSGFWPTSIFWGIVQGPAFAVILFTMALGAPVTLTNEMAGQSGCIVVAPLPFSSVGLWTGNMRLPGPYVLLLIIPVISLFLGGRISVAIAGIRSGRAALLQGALIAIPFAIFLSLASALSLDSTSITTPNTNPSTSAGIPLFGSLLSSTITTTQSIAVHPQDALLWGILAGIIVGAAGGIYQISATKTVIRIILRAITLPVRLLCLPFFFVLDRLTLQPWKQSRSQARTLLYGAFLLSVLLLILALAGGYYLLKNDQVLNAQQTYELRDLLSSALIFIPVLCLICAVALAWSSDLASRQASSSTEQVTQNALTTTTSTTLSTEEVH